MNEIDEKEIEARLAIVNTAIENLMKAVDGMTRIADKLISAVEDNRNFILSILEEVENEESEVADD